MKVETKNKKKGVFEAEEFEIHGDEFPAVTEALERLRENEKSRLETKE